MSAASNMARAFISSGLIVAAAPAHAGAWGVAGQGQVGVNYDDNVRLSTTNRIADFSGVSEASGALTYQDDDFVFSMNPRAIAVRYDAARAYNRTEQYLTLRAQKNSETGSTSLMLSGVQDTTLTSERQLTGLSEVNKKHRVGSVTLGKLWSITERVDLDSRLYVSASRYLDAEQTGLNDYNYGSALLSGSYEWTQRTGITLQASAGQLRIPDTKAYDKTNLSAMLGYRVQLAPRWRLALSAGPSQIRTRDLDDSGSVYDASLTHEAQRTSFNLGVSKDVTPNGFGLLSRREQVQLALTHTFSERWITDCSVALSRNQNVLPISGIEQQAVTYADIIGSVRWRITPTLSAAVAVGYTRQRITSLQPADRQHATLNITWNGLARSFN